MEPRWSEMGDRYVVKLFRDFVFHQLDEEGHPLLDLGHVMACLNKVSYYIRWSTKDVGELGNS